MIEQIRISLEKAFKKSLGDRANVFVEIQCDTHTNYQEMFRVEIINDFGPNIGPIVMQPDLVLDVSMKFYVNKILKNVCSEGK